MENKSESLETLELISKETGNDLKNSEKLLEFWGKKSEVKRRSGRISQPVGSMMVFGSGTRWSTPLAISGIVSHGLPTRARAVVIQRS